MPISIKLMLLMLPNTDGSSEVNWLPFRDKIVRLIRSLKIVKSRHDIPLLDKISEFNFVRFVKTSGAR